VVGFHSKADADQFRAELTERMRKFQLELHPEKTRLLEFGPFAIDQREWRGEGKPEAFNFLGFTHICVKKRSNGRFTVLRQTIRKRLQAKLNEVKAELQRRMHEPIPELGKWLQAVVRGHIRYYGVPQNTYALCLSVPGRAALASRAVAAQPERSRPLGSYAAPHHSLASCAYHLSSLSPAWRGLCANMIPTLILVRYVALPNFPANANCSPVFTISPRHTSSSTCSVKPSADHSTSASAFMASLIARNVIGSRRTDVMRSCSFIWSAKVSPCFLRAECVFTQRRNRSAVGPEESKSCLQSQSLRLRQGRGGNNPMGRRFAGNSAGIYRYTSRTFDAAFCYALAIIYWACAGIDLLLRHRYHPRGPIPIRSRGSLCRSVRGSLKRNMSP